MQELQKKVLVIDDEGDFLELMLLRLQKSGFLVDVALDGETGLQKVSSFEPDIILLDILMSGIDGWEVCRRLQAHPKNRNIPVFVLTALPPMEMEKSAKELGVRRIITKPFDDADLIKWIRQETGVVNGKSGG